MSNKLLEVKGLKQYFNVGKRNKVHAVNNISFCTYEREAFSLVGESGNGKSTTGRTIIRLNEFADGKILFDDQDVTKIKDKKSLMESRYDVQMIFQDPYASLNPRMKVRDIIAEGVDANGLAKPSEGRAKEVDDLLRTVGLNPSHGTRYPHESSDGQRQRIGTARALAVRPRLIICDEPVSALDVSIQAQMVNLLQNLQKKHQLTYLFVAHDLSMVKHISDRIGVMHNGSLLEMGTSDKIYNHGVHPYTGGLLFAILLLDPDHERKHRGIKYQPESDDGQVCQPRGITPEHFVYATEQEIPYYARKLKRQKEPLLVANQGGHGCQKLLNPVRIRQGNKDSN